jgi:hypothetical protein
MLTQAETPIDVFRRDRALGFDGPLMMYSARPYSALPYSADGRDFRAYFDMIMDLEASLTLKIYVSTGAGYASLPGDALPNQPFRGVLQSFSFSARSCRTISASSPPAAGSW